MEIDATFGLIVRVTDGFGLLATFATNGWACNGAKVTLPEVRATLTGTASLKIQETTDLFTDALIATAPTVAELGSEMGPEYS